jgi:hypothetical protein
MAGNVDHQLANKMCTGAFVPLAKKGLWPRIACFLWNDLWTFFIEKKKALMVRRLKHYTLVHYEKVCLVKKILVRN